ncbi:hypothetical protein P4S72_19150 [Vibrio sp. PP-XX7]
MPTLLSNLYMHKSVNHDESDYIVVGRAYMGNVYKLMITAGVLVFIFKKVDINAGVFVAFIALVV